MKKILLLVLALMLLCLPAWAAKAPKGGPAPVPSSQQIQIYQYPVVPCALSLPTDWTADIDDNDVLYAQKNEEVAIMVWANPKGMPFDSLSQLDERGKAAFTKQMKQEAAMDRANFKLDKEGFSTINNRTAYELEYSFKEQDAKGDTYAHAIYVIKDRKLLIITGYCPYAIAEISALNKIMDQIGF